MLVGKTGFVCLFLFPPLKIMGQSKWLGTQTKFLEKEIGQ